MLLRTDPCQLPQLHDCGDTLCKLKECTHLEPDTSPSSPLQPLRGLSSSANQNQNLRSLESVNMSVPQFVQNELRHLQPFRFCSHENLANCQHLRAQLLLHIWNTSAAGKLFSDRANPATKAPSTSPESYPILTCPSAPRVLGQIELKSVLQSAYTNSCLSAHDNAAASLRCQE